MPTKQTAKQVAINAAKQAARESNEVLRTAGEQIFSSSEKPQERQEGKKEDIAQNNPPQKNLSFLNEYKGELEQIRRDNLFKELQREIAEGEEISLENYVKELGSEQREVLKAQMEAMKTRREAAANQKHESIPQIISKRARGMMGIIKKRSQQHVEMRQPPSG